MTMIDTLYMIISLIGALVAAVIVLSVLSVVCFMIWHGTIGVYLRYRQKVRLDRQTDEKLRREFGYYMQHRDEIRDYIRKGGRKK